VGKGFQFGSSTQGRPEPAPVRKRIGSTLSVALGETVGSGFSISEGGAMKDTSDVVDRKYRDMLLKRSGEERLKMGCSMHATAQALVRASVLQADPAASPSSLRKNLFLRFYGQEFDSATRNRILRALERGSREAR